MISISYYSLRLDLGPYPVIETHVKVDGKEKGCRIEQTPSDNILYDGKPFGDKFVLSTDPAADSIILAVLDVAKRHNLATAEDWKTNKNISVWNTYGQPL
ncbi:hypothetical protein [Massilia horti]|uniref:Uncharacterized protein n=1 Tax=Massilia horti TaxID=2562153 RepID=A0A4Y9SQV0_9BURK|nr:hypothetical protein [Massilia horti]TFW28908.1 hypothetical protein E4O92_19935 [Massilia horti]